MNISIDINNIKKFFAPPNKEVCEATIQQCQSWKKLKKLSFQNSLKKDSTEYTNIKAIKELAHLHKLGSTKKKIKHFVLLGIGGSSLGAEALIRALHSNYKEPYFYFMNNNDPDFLSETLKHLEPETTLFYIVSKSGETLSTWSQLFICINWLKTHYKTKETAWKQHVVLCTENNNGKLHNFGKTNNLSCLEIPISIGGRFSALTPTTLFPAAFAALNIEEFLNGARSIVEYCEKKDMKQNFCFQMANALYQNKKRNITVCFSYSSYLIAFGKWFEQLWAESLGKDGNGFTPISAIGSTDQHSQLQLFLDGPKDKVIVFIKTENCKNPLLIEKIKNVTHFLNSSSAWNLFRSEFQATRDIITEKEIPNFTINIKDISEKSLGELMCFWLHLTVYTASLMQVEPFNQASVEKGKRLAKDYLNNTAVTKLY